MRGFTLGGFRFRFGIVFHTVHQVPQVQGAAAAAAAPPQAQPEGGEPAAAASAAAGVESPAEEVEGEVDNVQLRRYVAEVSASAMAVEQLAREGRLDLEPARAEAAEEWSDDDADEGEDALEEDEVNDSNEEIVGSSNAEAHCEEKGEGCSQSSQVQDSQKVSGESEPKMFKSVLESEQAVAADSELVPTLVEELIVQADSLPDSTVIPPPSVSLTNSDIQDVRQNLLSASHEARQLLRDLQNIDSSD